MLPKVNSVIEFLTMLYSKGNGYSSICSARSALSSIIALPNYKSLADHPLIKRFVKGVFNKRPPKPRYTFTWDVNVVLEHIKMLGLNKLLTLKQLTQKVCMLLLLCIGQRANTIINFDTEYMDLQESKVIFYPNNLLKHSTPVNIKDDYFVFEKFEKDMLLCPLEAINEYQSRRKELSVKDTSFLFTTKKPHKKPAPDTLSKWIKNFMIDAGIDTRIFKPHSCRSASTSKAADKGMDLDTILKYGKWSNASTFYKFYYRNTVEKTVEQAHSNNMQRKILDMEQ